MHHVAHFNSEIKSLVKVMVEQIFEYNTQCREQKCLPHIHSAHTHLASECGTTMLLC